MRNLREENSPTTVTLRDGRIVDVFPDGRVQVYSPDCAHGYEIDLPAATVQSGHIAIITYG